MEKLEISDEVREAARSAWRGYLDLVAPFRPELHRYCRKLTGNVWDAEDLLQDTLLKGFGALGMAPVPVANPRGYLVRIATNLWIDAQRRRARESEIVSSEAVTATQAAQPSDPSGVRNATARLIEQLAPQERAAIVLKDVFDMNLKEIAAALSTTENAVKAALHRGRARLTDEAPMRTRSASPGLIEKFVHCLNTADLPGALALMLDTAAIEMPPQLREIGRAEFERKGGWLSRAARPPEVQPDNMHQVKWLNRLVQFQGETIVLGLMPPSHGGTLQGINRFEEEDGRISRIRSYCFTPETIAEVGAELGLQVGWVPHRFPSA